MTTATTVTTLAPITPPSHVTTRAIHSTELGRLSATQRETLSSNETTRPPADEGAGKQDEDQHADGRERGLDEET